MSTDALKAPLKVVLVWHSSSEEATALGNDLNAQLASSASDAMMPGLGLDVRMVPLQAQQMGYDMLEAELLPQFNDFERVAVIALIGKSLKEDAAAQGFLLWLQDNCTGSDEMHRFFPVSLDNDAFGVDPKISNINFIRLQETEKELRDEQLMGRVCHELCRMLTDFPRYDEKAGKVNRVPPVRLFISHTKKDNGLKIAKDIARWFATEPPFDTFFDASEIPAGEPFPDVINENVMESTILVLQSDQYSTRYWCLEEVLRAKEYDRPLVGVYCLQNGEARSFPYLGNIPTLAWNAQATQETMMAVITRSVARETLKFLYFKKLCYFTWQTTAELVDKAGIILSARAPEMAVLARIRSATTHRTFVYPDPAISSNEEKFLLSAFPEFTLSAMNRFTWPVKEKVVADTSATAVLSPIKKPDTTLNLRSIANEVSAGDSPADDGKPDENPAKENNIRKNPFSLDGKKIGLSVSESEEMALMGRSASDIHQLLNHLIRELILQKASVIYGGDYRSNGFAERIEDLLRSYRSSSYNEKDQCLHSYLAWPYYYAPDDQLKAELKGFADFHYLSPPPDLKVKDPAPPLTDRSPETAYQVARCLSSMRAEMTAETSARLFIGGKVSGYLGIMPGIQEEFLLSLLKGVPVYLIGSYGGTTGEIIKVLKGETSEKLTTKWQQKNQPAWSEAFTYYYNTKAKADPSTHPLGAIDFDAWLKVIEKYAQRGLAAVLNNGLTEEENRKLFAATQPAEMIRLMMRGLERAMAT